MTAVVATAQHDNGASRPFAFLPKRRRSRSHPHTSHEDINDSMNDIDDTPVYPDNATSESASSSPPSQRHIFPTTFADPKTPMHIDIPQSVLVTSSHPVAPPSFIRKKSGELVKPSLKSTSSFASPPSVSSNSPSPSPASSRLRTTSAPATPSAAKSVHFDTQLEHVKLFLAGQKPLAVSREGSPVDMDTTSASEAEPDSFGISSYPFPSFKSKSRFGSSTAPSANSNGSSSSRSHTRTKLKLIQIYNLPPLSNPAIEPWSFDVRVESIRLSNPEPVIGPSNNTITTATPDAFPSLHGTVLVHNKAFTKTLFFRYTLDDWNTVSEVSCRHVHTLPGGIYDRFEYRVKLIGLATNRSEGERAPNVAFFNSGSISGFGSNSASRSRPPYRMEFCVRYNVPGWGEWWDSNGGRNYVVEFEWESESLLAPSTSAQQQPSMTTPSKIVSPQPQRFTSGIGASPLLQRLTRQSFPVSSSPSGTATPGHISPPPYTGSGSASMLDQRPPMPSPSFPPSFPSTGHSDYFNYNSNKPQAMHIPLRSRYDFGVSLREGAKIMKPTTVTSPPPSSSSAVVVASSSRSPPGAFTTLPSLNGGNEFSMPTVARIMSPTPVHGQFRHALATPKKKTSSSPQYQKLELAKEDQQTSPSSLDTGSLANKPETPVALTSSSTRDSSPVSDLSIRAVDASDASAAHPTISDSAPLLSPPGRRHVRSWLRTSMSDQHVSNGNDNIWGKVHVRKTMSLPGGFNAAADENVSPLSSTSQVDSSLHQDVEFLPSHSRQHHIDGDEDYESEEDGIWFGRRSSSGSSGAGVGTDVVGSAVTDAIQSDYDIVTSAMRFALLRNDVSHHGHSRSPSVRFHDLEVLLESEEPERDDEQDDNDEDINGMEMGDSSSSSVSSPTCSVLELREENEGVASLVVETAPGSEMGAAPSSSSSPALTTWSLSSSSTGASTSSSTVSFSHSPRVSTPSQFDARTIPLFNAKLARAVLSGTPRSASPSLDGTEHTAEIMPLSPSSLKLHGSGGTHFPNSAVMESPSSEGSVTPKADEISTPFEFAPSPTAAAGSGVDSKGINLNSSSYYSLLNQFCFFTGSKGMQGQGQGQLQLPQTVQTPKPEVHTRERRVALRNATTTTGAGISSEITADRSRTPRHDVNPGRSIRGSGQSRSSSAEPSYPPSSSSYSFHPEFGINFGFSLDGFGGGSASATNNDDTHHHFPFRPYGMLKSLGRSFSDPTETFSVRSPYGEQVTGGVS